MTSSDTWTGDNQARNRRSGLSLVEIGIAAAIIAAAVVPMVVSMIGSRTGLVASMDEVGATADATRTIEALKRLPFDEVPISNDNELVPDSAWNDQRFAWPTEVASPAGRAASASLAALGPPPADAGMRRSLSISLVPAAPGDSARMLFLKLAEVRITWQRRGSDGTGQESVTLATMLKPPPGP
ncbi:MAG: hypothetical protein HY303_02880 [Candidatus Wallbacteria bacterium]|nr:hypothetical protein [Candidatus Wallbacteria bacterium]